MKTIEVFRGTTEGLEFQNWLKGLGKVHKARMVVVGDFIYCDEARRIIEQAKRAAAGSLNHTPWLVESVNKAVLHLVVCQNRDCTVLLQGLVQGDS